MNDQASESESDAEEDQPSFPEDLAVDDDQDTQAMDDNDGTARLDHTDTPIPPPASPVTSSSNFRSRVIHLDDDEDSFNSRSSTDGNEDNSPDNAYDNF
jgi:hypothetical protein